MSPLSFFLTFTTKQIKLINIGPISFLKRTTIQHVLTDNNRVKWNETFRFLFAYPSLIRLFKIELCSTSTFGEKVLATEYLDIDYISNYSSDNYFFPTMGPSYIDLYTEPENLRYKTLDIAEENEESEESNNDEEEGESNYSQLLTNDYTDARDFESDIFIYNKARTYAPICGNTPSGGEYVGRLLIGIKSSRVDPFKTKIDRMTQSKKDKTISSFQKLTKNFTLFCVLSECLILDERYVSNQSTNLSFQLCLGTYGYENVGELDLSSDVKPSNITKEQCAIHLSDKMPFYLPYEKSKPCLSLNFDIEDQTYKMFTQNFIRSSLRLIVILFLLKF
jgi:hypothetical protein